MTPTTNLSLKKIDGSENWREIFDDHNDSMDLIDAAVKSNSDEISTTEKSLIYVVDGNKCANAVPVGSYVQLINSTISGRSDGCYTVKTAIPANTAIDNTYFNETAPIAGGAINSLNSKLMNRKFILIGDSFGGGVDGDNNTQPVSGGGWINRFRTTTGYTVYNSQTPLGGVYGFASSRPFIDVLHDAEQYINDKSTITDIVVLGGTNDIGISESTIITKIQEFVTYCRSTYPRARIAIGCIGTNIPDLRTMYNNCYSKCANMGAEPIHDTLGLMCLRKYIGADGTHLTAAGYAFYQEFINPAILTSKSRWYFTESTIGTVLPISMNSNFSTNYNPLRLTFTITNDTFSAGIVGQDRLIANVIPVDAASTSSVTIANQDYITPIIRYATMQQVSDRAIIYFGSGLNFDMQRNYGLSSEFNGFSPGNIVTLSY